MTTQPPFFYDHLIPPGPYQTVTELCSNSPESTRLVRCILTTAVARTLCSLLPEEASDITFAKKLVQEDPEFLRTVARKQPDIYDIIRQVLDRTLLALTTRLQ